MSIKTWTLAGLIVPVALSGCSSSATKATTQDGSFVPLTSHGPTSMVVQPVGIRFVLTPSHANVSDADTYELTARITNNGNENVLLLESQYPFERWKVDGWKNGEKMHFKKRMQDLTREQCDPMVRSRQLVPSAAFEQKLRLSDFFDLSEPGTYMFRLSRGLLVERGGCYYTFECVSDAQLIVRAF